MFKIVRVSGPEKKSHSRFIKDLMVNLNATLAQAGERHQHYRRVITSTWDAETPRFVVRMKSGGGKVIMRFMLSNGTYIGNKKWYWLNDGTDARYATMTKDFMPKTKPGIIRGFGGRGGLAYVSRKMPRNPIEAREFDEAIGKKDRAKLDRDILDAVGKALK